MAATPDGRHAFRPAAGDTAVQEAAALVEEAAVILEVLGETWLRGFVEIERGIALQMNNARSRRLLRALLGSFATLEVGTALIFPADQYVDRWLGRRYGMRSRGSPPGQQQRRCRLSCRMRTRAHAYPARAGPPRRSPRDVVAVAAQPAIDFAAVAVPASGTSATTRADPAHRPAAEAFVCRQHPATTPFARAQVVADLESLAEQLGGAEIDHIRRGAELAEMDAVADRAVHLLGVPGPLSPGASLFDRRATAQAA